MIPTSRWDRIVMDNCYSLLRRNAVEVADDVDVSSDGGEHMRWGHGEIYLRHGEGLLNKGHHHTWSRGIRILMDLHAFFGMSGSERHIFVGLIYVAINNI